MRRERISTPGWRRESLVSLRAAFVVQRVLNRLVVAVLIASTLYLSGCGPFSHKVSPRPLAKKSTFEIFIESSTDGPGTKTVTDPISHETNHWKTPAVITTADVATVSLTQDGGDKSTPSLTVNLTPAGAAKLSAISEASRGMKLAIEVNGTILATPKINSTLSKHVMIAGSKSQEMFNLLTKETQ